MADSDVGLDLGLLAAAGAVGEGEVGEVAGQADPRAHDDVALGAGAAEPFAGGSGQVVQSSCVGVLEAELVAEPRGLFVIFAGDRRRGAGCGAGGGRPAAGAAPGDLADVPGGAVVPLEQGQQPACEDLVVVAGSRAGRRPGTP